MNGFSRVFVVMTNVNGSLGSSLARMMSARISGYNTSTVEDEGERVFLDRRYEPSGRVSSEDSISVRTATTASERPMF